MCTIAEIHKIVNRTDESLLFSHVENTKLVDTGGMRTHDLREFFIVIRI